MSEKTIKILENIIKVYCILVGICILIILIAPFFSFRRSGGAKSYSFTDEIKEIYKSAQQQWIMDSMTTDTTISYYTTISYFSYDKGAVKGATAGPNASTGLDMSGRPGLDFYITLNKSGDVTHFYATDGTYQYYWNTGENLKIENIGTGTAVGNNYIEKVAKAESNKFVCIGSKGGSTVSNGSPLEPYILGANNTFSSNTICY